MMELLRPTTTTPPPTLVAAFKAADAADAAPNGCGNVAAAPAPAAADAAAAVSKACPRFRQHSSR